MDSPESSGIFICKIWNLMEFLTWKIRIFYEKTYSVIILNTLLNSMDIFCQFVQLLPDSVDTVPFSEAELPICQKYIPLFMRYGIQKTHTS